MEKYKKKLENIWYYYKVPIIIGLVILYLIGNVVISKKNEVKYDNSIAIISKENYPSEEEIVKIKEVFENKYNCTFDVVIYNVALGEENEDEVTISKLDLDLRNKISMYLFIEDMDAFKKTTADIEFSEVVLVNNTDWLSDLGLDNFYFATRK